MLNAESQNKISVVLQITGLYFLGKQQSDEIFFDYQFVFIYFYFLNHYLKKLYGNWYPYFFKEQTSRACLIFIYSNCRKDHFLYNENVSTIWLFINKFWYFRNFCQVINVAAHDMALEINARLSYQLWWSINIMINLKVVTTWEELHVHVIFLLMRHEAN